MNNTPDTEHDEHATTVLAIDTALIGCCVAVKSPDKNVTHTVEPMRRGQAAKLVPIIEDILERHGVEFPDLDLIGTTVGPGSFTGVRVGMTTARTLGLALDIPVIGVTTLDVIARQVLEQNTPQDNEILAVLLETKRRDYYLGLYDKNGQETAPPRVLSRDALVTELKDKPVIFAGDAVKRLQEELEDTQDTPQTWRFLKGYDLLDPETLVTVIIERYRSFKGKEIPKPEPLYLRGADVSQPKRKPRTIIYED